MKALHEKEQRLLGLHVGSEQSGEGKVAVGPLPTKPFHDPNSSREERLWRRQSRAPAAPAKHSLSQQAEEAAPDFPLHGSTGDVPKEAKCERNLCPCLGCVKWG